ncbi:unnamed protein product [Cochlearia groenlandica]
MDMSGPPPPCDEEEEYNIRAASYGSDQDIKERVDEQEMKQKWDMASLETKKRINDKCKLFKATKLDILLHKVDIMHYISNTLFKEEEDGI